VTTIPTARARNPRGEGARLREEILAAADRLLDATRSETELSLRALAREAGIAAPSIYQHFADRHEVVTELLRRRFDALVARMQDVLARERGADARGRVHTVARVYCEFAAERPAHYRLMFGFAQEAVSLEELSRHPIQRLLDMFAEVLGPAIGSDDPERSRLAASSLLAVLHGALSLRYSLPLSIEQPAFTERISRYVDVVIAGNSAPGGGAPA